MKEKALTSQEIGHSEVGYPSGDTIEDTIAAIATPPGEGGIGIIRISGSGALPILQDIFECAGEGGEITDHRLLYGRIVDRDKNQLIDECMAVYMKGPRTYTAEDTAEIDCHGSMVSLKNTLQLVLRKGARMAEPGEFTRRAFLNGRIDLSQAEAVIDVVRARTDRSFDVAISQLEGGLSLQVRKIRNHLLDLLVDITVNIDYPDEDIEAIAYDNMETDLAVAMDMTGHLLATASAGRLLREGIRMAITGRPNVGKSSLMNGLLRENRAIVTDIPGTTRDTIEESANIRGIPVNLIDTAGIHETEDIIEQMGIQRSQEAFRQADYVILVLDGSQPLQEEDRRLLETVGSRKCLVLLNKQDLGQVVEEKDIEEAAPGAVILKTAVGADTGGNMRPDAGSDAGVGTGTVAGSGIEAVEEEIERFVYGSDALENRSERIMVNNVRHIQLLTQAEEDLKQALEMTGTGQPLELIEVNVRAAFDSLGEIIGETVNDQILDEVFHRFCLGK